MSDPTKPKADYVVGYGRTPVEYRFKKGQTGNAGGRRKGRPSAQELIMREAAKLVKVKRGDQIEAVTKLERTISQLWQMAMEGDLGASRLLFTVMPAAPPDAGEDAVADETARLSLPVRPEDEVLRRMLARFQHLKPDDGA